MLAGMDSLSSESCLQISTEVFAGRGSRCCGLCHPYPALVRELQLLPAVYFLLVFFLMNKVHSLRALGEFISVAWGREHCVCLPASR